MPAADPLAAEQAHLSHARSQLARMRERTLSLEAHGGDAVSSEYLAATLYRRAASLTDDPTSTLFFGRIDTDGTNPTDTAGQPERFRATFNVEGRKAVFEVTTSSVINPFRMNDLTNFNCPGKL